MNKTGYEMWARLGVTLYLDSHAFSLLLLSDDENRKNNAIMDAILKGRFKLDGETIVYTTSGEEIFTTDLYDGGNNK